MMKGKPESNPKTLRTSHYYLNRKSYYITHSTRSFSLNQHSGWWRLPDDENGKLEFIENERHFKYTETRFLNK